MKSILTLILLLVVSHFSSAQIIEVKKNRTKTDNGTINTISVYFVDTTSKIISDSLDLHNLNPYNQLPYEISSSKMGKDKTYEINSFNEYDKLFPSNYRSKYFIDYFVEPGKYIGLLSSTFALSSYEKPVNYIAIAFNLFARPNYSDQIDGAISTIFVFDNKKNLVYKKENVLCVDNEIAISDDGKYLAFRYGAAWSDGILLKSGVQIVNTNTDTIVFEESNGYVEGPVSGYYPDLIEFACYLGNYFVRDYYFNTKKSKLYSLRYNSHEKEGTLIDIKPDGLLYMDRNGEEYILLFDKDLEVQIIK